jgi:hypothetical protein
VPRARRERVGEERLLVQRRITAGARHSLGRQRLEKLRARQAGLAELPPGSIVSIEGDYGPEAIAVFLTLVAAGHVVVPLSRPAIF